MLEGISKMPKGEDVLPMQGKRNRMSHRSLPEMDAVVSSSNRTPNHQSKVNSSNYRIVVVSSESCSINRRELCSIEEAGSFVPRIANGARTGGSLSADRTESGTGFIGLAK